ncbi:sucrase-isomaltase, intestinal-like [Stegodyphus dumicola]|uniref:sucrase-isomaltase, intestinal-like n=1 Tax=Stegodyphus dumicola TaxID=202533 RepID=UPI0015AFA451|nr:sucrase-isomaltase, intestinal-like [Stegodyphus dumicola]
MLQEALENGNIESSLSWKDRFNKLKRKFKKNYKLITLIAVVVISLVLLIVLLATLLPRRRGNPDENDRIECPGFKSKESCEKSGCSYDYINNGPSCYVKSDRFRYKVLSQTAKPDGVILKLEATEQQTPYGPSFPQVKFEVTYITENIIRFKLSDGTENYQPYEVPVQDHFPLLRNEINIDANNLSYKVSYSNEADYFHMNISRIEGVTLWDTRIGGLIMSEKYLQIASYLPSKNIYGLGEHVHETFRHSLNYVSWPLFSRDRPPMGGQKNLYGVHPFYTCLENDGKSHGVLLLNSNAMEVTLLPAPAISFRTIGGVLDFFVFVGENPEHVVQLYTSLVGRPILPPYWGLGFQLSRYGYNKLENVRAVVERTRDAGIMQDVQFLDIDHMEGRRDFTWDNTTFAGLPEYIQETKEKYGLKWIIILDPAIEVKANYSPYESGINNNVFIKRPTMWPDSIFPPAVQDLNVTFGRVWPRDIVAFPDFFLKSAKQWWINQIVEHYSKIPFDGLWIVSKLSSFS